VGVLGNMVRGSGKEGSAGVGPRRLAKEFGVPLLGLLPYDSAVARAVERGSTEELLRSRFARALRRAVASYLRDLVSASG